jgi:hypothetical protein
MNCPLSRLSGDQWMDIIHYLGADDLGTLRLAGAKDMRLRDPRLTSHLPLRMDRAAFFLREYDDADFPGGYVRGWLANRRRLAIDDADAEMSPGRVGRLVSDGSLDSVSEVVVRDCHRHGSIIGLLSRLPNLESLTLVDHHWEFSPSRSVRDELEAVVAHVSNMRSLRTLDIEFGPVIHGSRLSFLRGVRGLRQLRLVGFDLSEGIGHIGCLRHLESLHLCHGNAFSSPTDDVNEKHLTNLIGLERLRRLHLEGFDCITGAGLAPFAASGRIQRLVMKHCQEQSDECLAQIGRMTNLTSLHFVLAPNEDFEVFGRESLLQLNALSGLRSLSLFHLLDDPEDLRVLTGLRSLETLNIAVDETIAPNATMNDEFAQELILAALHTFPSLRTVRIFSENLMEHAYRYGGSLDVEYSSFVFGDLVNLD